jgi:hypothetical protein
MSSERSLIFRSSDQKFVCISHLSYACYIPHDLLFNFKSKEWYMLISVFLYFVGYIWFESSVKFISAVSVIHFAPCQLVWSVYSVCFFLKWDSCTSETPETVRYWNLHTSLIQRPLTEPMCTFIDS